MRLQISWNTVVEQKENRYYLLSYLLERASKSNKFGHSLFLTHALF